MNMQIIGQWFGDHSALLTTRGYMLLSASANAMPEPTPGDKRIYIFCYRFLNQLAQNKPRTAAMAILLGLMMLAGARAQLIEQVGGAHAILPRAERGPLGLGETWASPEGLTWRRISDWKEIGLAFSNNPTSLSARRGYTNGYSKYPASNATGEYVIAWGSETNRNALYRVADRKFFGYIRSKAANQILSEGHNVRWGAGTTIYYQTTSVLWKQDVLKGTNDETRVWAIPDALRRIYPTGSWYLQNEDHMDQGGIYRPVRVRCDGTTGTLYAKTLVINLETGTALPVEIPRADVMDVSPSGRWLLVNEAQYADNRSFLYRTDELAAGVLRPVMVPGRAGHDGWAYDKQGNDAYVYQNNRTDQIVAFVPETGARTDLIGLLEMTYQANVHPMRVANPEARGVAVLSTYTSDSLLSEGWARGQLIAVEIGGARRIARLGSTQTQWLPDKNAWYFCEAWASLSMDAQKIWIGSNWGGRSNLELHEVSLPARWWGFVGIEPTPTPAPTPAPSVTPSPTPGPQGQTITLYATAINQTFASNNPQAAGTQPATRAYELRAYKGGGYAGEFDQAPIIEFTTLTLPAGAAVAAARLDVATTYTFGGYVTTAGLQVPVSVIGRAWQPAWQGAAAWRGASWRYAIQSADSLYSGTPWSNLPSREKYGWPGDLSSVLTTTTCALAIPLRPGRASADVISIVRAWAAGAGQHGIYLHVGRLINPARPNQNGELLRVGMRPESWAVAADRPQIVVTLAGPVATPTPTPQPTATPTPEPTPKPPTVIQVRVGEQVVIEGVE